MTLREAIGQYIAWRRAQGARFQSKRTRCAVTAVALVTRWTATRSVATR